MLISFDLDNTLICYDPRIPREPNRVPWYWRWRFREPLRLGTVKLCQTLSGRGHQVAVFTTSMRSCSYIRTFLGFYGIKPKPIINHRIYQSAMKRNPDGAEAAPSKNPRLFDIDLHVDDAEGVGHEAATHGFKALILNPMDHSWMDKVLTEVGSYQYAVPPPRLRASQAPR